MAYPSITTVLSKTNPNRHQFQKQKNNHNLMETGTQVHSILSHFLKHKRFPHSQPSHITRHLANFVPYLLKISQPRTEVSLSSSTYKIRGKADVIGKYEGENAIIEFKTKQEIQTPEQIQELFLQPCAYSLMKPDHNKLVLLISVQNNQSQAFVSYAHLHKAELLHRIAKYYHTVHNVIK